MGFLLGNKTLANAKDKIILLIAVSKIAYMKPAKEIICMK